MPEHVHGCLNCRPEMVPDFSRDDPRYHDGEKCLHPIVSVSVDGVELGFTHGVFGGREGWALFCGATVADIHECPTCSTYAPLAGGSGTYLTGEYHICVEPRFGVAVVEHAAPVMIDAAEVIAHLPPGYPWPLMTPTERGAFDHGYQTFFDWLHKAARQP